jgi:hypothetical protein
VHAGEALDTQDIRTQRVRLAQTDATLAQVRLTAESASDLSVLTAKIAEFGAQHGGRDATGDHSFRTAFDGSQWFQSVAMQ